MTRQLGRNLRASLAIALAASLSVCASAKSPAPAAAPAQSAARPPNIIILYADDLGYGDVGAYGSRRIRTPNVDALAAKGLRFTNGYAPAATCTPSRYSLLTGEYGFRNEAQILPGDAPALIRPGKATIASMLKTRGYTTGVIGKWHLGLGNGQVDWNADVSPGPLEIGFDYSFLLPATLDRVPTVYLENHRVVGLQAADPLSVSYDHQIGDRPVGRQHPELLRYKADDQHSDSIINGVSRIGYMQGGKSAEWVDEQIHQVITDKARGFIRSNRDHPFFLYLAMPEPHVPRLPGRRFVGATGLGPRGDAVVEMDWIVGQIMAELRSQGLADNTLVIFSSDNWPVLNDGYEDGAAALLGDHQPGGPFRGGKYSAFEAGTHVPLIVSWPGHVRTGVSKALVSHVDLFASLGRLVGASLADNVAIDSRDLSAALLGRDPVGRDFLFTESVPSQALRDTRYKYIAPALHPQSAAFIATKGIESGAQRTAQLYDLSRDPGERNNIAAANSAETERLAHELAIVRQAKTAQRAPREGVR